MIVKAARDIRFENGSWTGEYGGKIQHNSNNLYIQGGSGGFRFRSSAGSNQITIDANGDLYPSNDNAEKLGLSSNRWANIYGGYVSAIINEGSTQTTGEFRNSHSTYGGGVRFRSNNTYGMLQFTTYNNSSTASFYNSTGGWHWDSNMQFHGSVTPWTNANLNLGSSSKRWANLYINDLQLSNESKKDTGGNDVDGTWGDWTLQEGENKIFMINNRTGKKYSLKMEVE